MQGLFGQHIAGLKRKGKMSLKNNLKEIEYSNFIKLLFGLIIFISLINISLAMPIGPSITVITNETKTIRSAEVINTSGGSITTMVLNGTTQNPRWKAYVGNVTGKLTLDNGNNRTIFDWSLTTLVGEVYVTRSSDSINWTGINCSNATHISVEEIALNHTNRDDNLTKTFNDKTHAGFWAGTSQILANSCFSVNTYVNSTSQQADFEQVVLYDGTNESNGNIVYATPLENDVYGYDNQTYDFQMIVPENGLVTWTSSIAYYFYVELT